MYQDGFDFSKIMFVTLQTSLLCKLHYALKVGHVGYPWKSLDMFYSYIFDLCYRNKPNSCYDTVLLGALKAAIAELSPIGFKCGVLETVQQM